MVDTADESRLHSLKHDIDTFFSALHSSYEVVRLFESEYRPVLAPDFCVFDYIDPGEETLSDILRDLLDPSGQHAQGRVFLDLFIADVLTARPEQIEALIEALRAGKVDVSREVSAGPMGRIDIVLTVNGPGPEYGVLIENKPWALEQDAQLDRYRRYGESRFPHNRFILVFLGGNVEEPSSMDRHIAARLECEGRLKIAWYSRELATWLARCAAAARSDHVRDFLNDFSSYIKNEFPGVRDES